MGGGPDRFWNEACLDLPTSQPDMMMHPPPGESLDLGRGQGTVMHHPVQGHFVWGGNKNGLQYTDM